MVRLVSGAALRALCHLVTALIVASGWSSSPAQADVPCREIPLAFDLARDAVTCEKVKVNPVAYDLAHQFAAKGDRWMLDDLLAWHPQDADSYTLFFKIDDFFGKMIISTAHARHRLAEVDLQRALGSASEGLSSVYGEQADLSISWLSAGVLEGYRIQRYREGPQELFGIKIDPRECFGFARYWDGSDHEFRRRLVGYYCQGAEKPIDDATVKRVLKAISVR